MSEGSVISVEQQDDVLLLTVQSGNLDEEGTKALQNEVTAAAEGVQDGPVVLEMSRLDMMPSLSLGALVNILRHFKGQGRRFYLVGMQSRVRSALAITHLDKLFEIYDSLDDLKEYLQESEVS